MLLDVLTNKPPNAEDAAYYGDDSDQQEEGRHPLHHWKHSGHVAGFECCDACIGGIVVNWHRSAGWINGNVLLRFSLGFESLPRPEDYGAGCVLFSVYGVPVPNHRDEIMVVTTAANTRAVTANVRRNDATLSSGPVYCCLDPVARL